MIRRFYDPGNPSVLETIGTSLLIVGLMMGLACMLVNPILDKLDVVNFRYFGWADATHFYVVTAMVVFTIIGGVGGLFLWIDHKLYPDRPCEEFN